MSSFIVYFSFSVGLSFIVFICRFLLHPLVLLFSLPLIFQSLFCSFCHLSFIVFHPLSFLLSSIILHSSFSILSFCAPLSSSFLPSSLFFFFHYLLFFPPVHYPLFFFHYPPFFIHYLPSFLPLSSIFLPFIVLSSIVLHFYPLSFVFFIQYSSIILYISVHYPCFFFYYSLSSTSCLLSISVLHIFLFVLHVFLSIIRPSLFVCQVAEV